MKEATEYHVLLKTLHWLMGALIIVMLLMGFLMLDADLETKGFIYPLHKKIGVSLMCLFCVRVSVRFFTVKPPHHPSLSHPIQLLANLTHFLLYASMLAMPISGYIMSNASNKPVPWFFGVEMPKVVEPDPQLAKLARDMHSRLSYMFAGLVVLHILATLKHIKVDRIPLMRRIL